MNLYADYLTNQNRPMTKWKHYFPIYERHFHYFVNRPMTIFEIGICGGGSLQMWKRYFGPHANIIGLDIEPGFGNWAEDQIEMRFGDQKDEAFLAEVLAEFGPPDIVLDDGSHRMSDVCATFRYLYPRLNPTGVYMVEDMHTAYWPAYEGGLRRDGTFIELSKNLIDELNADYTHGALAPTEFTKSTLSMHFYDSAVVFERGRHTKKLAPQTGGA